MSGLHPGVEETVGGKILSDDLPPVFARAAERTAALSGAGAQHSRRHPVRTHASNVTQPSETVEAECSVDGRLIEAAAADGAVGHIPMRGISNVQDVSHAPHLEHLEATELVLP